MRNVLEIRNLEKGFKDVKALKGISFEVAKGEILALLGPNGAGKSTVVNIISTALKADGGEIIFKGENIFKNATAAKQRLGIVPQNIALYEDLSAEANLAFFASLYGLRGRELKERVDEALLLAGLTKRRNHKVKTFSGGMKRRLNIVCALAHGPEIIIMDEPTVGIDPQSRKHILDSIKKLQQLGTTVIYSTHYMEEAEEIASRIIIIDHGQIIAQGTKEQLKKEVANGKIYTIQVDRTDSLPKDVFFGVEGIKDVEVTKNEIRLTSVKGIENLDKIITIIINNQLAIYNITSSEVSLETVFLKLTGRSLRD